MVKKNLETEEIVDNGQKTTGVISLSGRKINFIADRLQQAVENNCAPVTFSYKEWISVFYFLWERGILVPGETIIRFSNGHKLPQYVVVTNAQLMDTETSEVFEPNLVFHNFSKTEPHCEIVGYNSNLQGKINRNC